MNKTIDNQNIWEAYSPWPDEQPTADNAELGVRDAFEEWYRTLDSGQQNPASKHSKWIGFLAGFKAAELL